MFKKTCDDFPDKPFLGTNINNKYHWKTYTEVREISNFIQSGFVNLDLIPSI